MRFASFAGMGGRLLARRKGDALAVAAAGGSSRPGPLQASVVLAGWVAALGWVVALVPKVSAGVGVVAADDSSGMKDSETGSAPEGIASNNSEKDTMRAPVGVSLPFVYLGVETVPP